MILPVVVVLVLMAVCYVALGPIFGALLTVAQTSGACAVVLIPTIFGGAWFDLEEISCVFLTIGDAWPFEHALDASRAVLADGRAGATSPATSRGSPPTRRSRRCWRW